MAERVGISPVTEAANAEPASVRAPRTRMANRGVDRFLHVQQVIGNSAMQNLLAGGLLQPKLRIGPVDDVYEREADRTADRVMRMPDPHSDDARPLQAPISRVQRMCADCEEEEGDKLRRQVQDEEEEVLEKEDDESLLRKAKASAAPPVDAGIESHITSLRGGGRPLSPSVRSFFEPRFNHDFSDVRLHTGATATGVANVINARAFTIGSDITFGAGEYAPNSDRGRRLLGHELTHVVQQNSTTIRKCPLIQRAADAGLEREADVMGSNAVQMTRRTPVALRPVSSTIQRKPVPLQKAPKGAMSIHRFIELVEKEESKYPEAEQTNTKLMITRIRKIFYGRESWDKYLIAGAKNVKAPYTTTKKETGRKTLDLPGPFNLDIVRSEHTVTDKQGNTPEIAKNQEIALSDGTFVDLGHVFAGLDAHNNPQQVDGPGTVNITSNKDAVTWVGDLGSAVAELVFKKIELGRDPTKAEGKAIFEEFASSQDMIGNIDAYVIANQFAVGSATGSKPSEILREFYLGKSAKGQTPARDKRFTIFAREVGLQGWDGSKWSNEADWVDNSTDEINDAAALYVGANTEGVAKYPFAVGMSMNATAKSAAKSMLESLRKRAAQEPQD